VNEVGVRAMIVASLGPAPRVRTGTYGKDRGCVYIIPRSNPIHLNGSIFAFPGRIGVTVLLFTVGATIVAALYPARRAAKVDPVSALRYD
jgi:ABC-type antimicrobial peptide transport system permease subunit